MSGIERRGILVFVMEKTIANLGLRYIPQSSALSKHARSESALHIGWRKSPGKQAFWLAAIYNGEWK